MEQDDKNENKPVIPLKVETESDSSKDPLRIMIEIAKEVKLS